MNCVAQQLNCRVRKSGPLIKLVRLINMLVSPRRSRLKISIYPLVKILPVVLLVAIRA